MKNRKLKADPRFRKARDAKRQTKTERREAVQIILLPQLWEKEVAA